MERREPPRRASRSSRRPLLISGGLVAVLAVTAALIATCGGAEEAQEPAAAEVRVDRIEVENPEPADRALIAMECAPDADGVWHATGRLVNTVSRKTDYVVTTLVLDGEGTTLGGVSERFTLGRGKQAAIDFQELLAENPAAEACTTEVVRAGRSS